MDARRAQIAEGEAFPAAALNRETVRLERDADRETRWAAWQKDNADAIASWNALIEEHGLPLERYRSF